MMTADPELVRKRPATPTIPRADLEAKLFSLIERPPSAVTLFAPAGFGKTELLRRMAQLLVEAPETPWMVAMLDLRRLRDEINPPAASRVWSRTSAEDPPSAKGSGSVLPAMSRALLRILLGEDVGNAAQPDPAKVISSFLSQALGPRLALFIDNADALVGMPGNGELLGMLRSLVITQQHSRFWLCLAVSSNPSDLDTDVDGSPFNVSHQLPVPAFSVVEAELLAGQFGLDSAAAPHSTLAELIDLVGGTPLLVNTALAATRARQRSLWEVLQEGHAVPQIFASHLAELASLVHGQPALFQRLLQIRNLKPLAVANFAAQDAALYGLGLIAPFRPAPGTPERWRLRTPLYERWASALGASTLAESSPPEPDAILLQPAGTVVDSALYVRRQADVELPRRLLEHQLCYVVAPRQVGKSSLCARTQRVLEREGVVCAFVDLQALGRPSDEDAFFLGLCQEIARQLRLHLDTNRFWEQQSRLEPAQRWLNLLREVVLDTLPQNIVIFIDELDVTLALPFNTDAFFTTLRVLHEDRTNEPELERLTFCLLGAVSPEDLIRDVVATPFSIGRSILLDDFSRDECSAFLPALHVLGEAAQPVLQAIYNWTDGHPYMTQRLCADVVYERGPSSAVNFPVELVARAVEERFIRRGRQEDPNLHSAELRLFSKRNSTPFIQTTLRLYRALLEGRQIALDERRREQRELLLCGLAARRADHEGKLLLRTRNRIFREVFDAAWVREHGKDRELAEPLERWLEGMRGAQWLLRGNELKNALSWAQKTPDLTVDEAQFITQSQVAEHATQKRRQLWVALTTIILLLAIWYIAYFITITKIRQAEKEKFITEKEKIIAEQQLARLENQIFALSHDRNQAQSEIQNQKEKLTNMTEQITKIQRAIQVEEQGISILNKLASVSANRATIAAAVENLKAELTQLASSDRVSEQQVGAEIALIFFDKPELFGVTSNVKINQLRKKQIDIKNVSQIEYHKNFYFSSFSEKMLNFKQDLDLLNAKAEQRSIPLKGRQWEQIIDILIGHECEKSNGDYQKQQCVTLRQPGGRAAFRADALVQNFLHEIDGYRTKRLVELRVDNQRRRQSVAAELEKLSAQGAAAAKMQAELEADLRAKNVKLTEIGQPPINYSLMMAPKSQGGNRTGASGKPATGVTVPPGRRGLFAPPLGKSDRK